MTRQFCRQKRAKIGHILGEFSHCAFTAVAAANNVTMHCLERQALQKVPTVATDKELEAILEARNQGFKAKKKALDPRKARSLRRKLYLDLYGEVAQRMLI